MRIEQVASNIGSMNVCVCVLNSDQLSHAQPFTKDTNKSQSEKGNVYRSLPDTSTDGRSKTVTPQSNRLSMPTLSKHTKRAGLSTGPLASIQKD